MIINESYFDDLEIKDEDIAVDDDNDVDEPKHELTLDEFHKLPEQYNNLIRFQIEADDNTDSDTTFIQTSLLPRLFKKLDTIFELYGIEHSQYVLVSYCSEEDCDTVIKFGDYQLFCEEDHKYIYTKNIYEYFYINVYVNYPKFNYKRAFRFLYTVLNLFRIGRISSINIEPNTTNDYYDLSFWFKITYIEFTCFNNISFNEICKIKLGKELIEDKREFYKSVFRHFFGDGVNVPYDAIEKDVPLKPFRFE